MLYNNVFFFLHCRYESRQNEYKGSRFIEIENLDIYDKSNRRWVPSDRVIENVLHVVRHGRFLGSSDVAEVEAFIKEKQTEGYDVLYEPQQCQCHGPHAGKDSGEAFCGGVANGKCKPFLLMWIPRVSKAFFTNNPQQKVGLDGTGQVLRTHWQLFTLMGLNMGGAGVPMGHMISQRQDAQTVKRFVKFVGGKLGYLPKQIIIDMAGSEINAVEELSRENTSAKANSKMDFILCYFHVMKAVGEYVIKKKFPEEVQHVVVAGFQDMHNARTSEDVDDAWEKVELRLRSMDKKFKPACEHLKSEYYDKRKHWCIFYQPRIDYWGTMTNNHVESFHSYLKRSLLNHNKNLKLGVLLAKLFGRTYGAHWANALKNPSMTKARLLLRASMTIAHQLIDMGNVTVIDRKMGLVDVLSTTGASGFKEVYRCNVVHRTCSCDEPTTRLCHHLLAGAICIPELKFNIRAERTDVGDRSMGILADEASMEEEKVAVDINAVAAASAEANAPVASFAAAPMQPAAKNKFTEIDDDCATLIGKFAQLFRITRELPAAQRNTIMRQVTTMTFNMNATGQRRMRVQPRHVGGQSGQLVGSKSAGRKKKNTRQKKAELTRRTAPNRCLSDLPPSLIH